MSLLRHIEQIRDFRTPAYVYDFKILLSTLDEVINEADKNGFTVHYAVKANANSDILRTIAKKGLGADCVSGNEILRSIECGFKPELSAFAGVGKSDEEINIGLDNNIFSFNVESLEELEVINQMASARSQIANIALRINPDVESFTHKYINTGIEESKFGISVWDLEKVCDFLQSAKNLKLTGLHFHIGSQIKRLTPFRALCAKINEIQDWFNNRNFFPEHINVGGGLGINYDDPDKNPDFTEYFSLFREHLNLRKRQKVHFELGRSIIGQCGSLITRVLYVKKGVDVDFLIVDAGMTDLMRPALYQAIHKIENISSGSSDIGRYNVVGPICESTDSFGSFLDLSLSKRGDLLAIRSAGAYGYVMASNYNLRKLPAEYILE